MRWRSLFSGELAVALVILVAAMAMDFLWIRPRESELAALGTRKRIAERALLLSARETAELEAVREYAGAGVAEGDTWESAYTEQDPLRLLEEKREEAGLRRLDLRLLDREAVPPFTRTTYFMSVSGDFKEHLVFLKSLERTRPLVTVEAFTMETRERERGVIFRLNVSVLTLIPGGAS